MRTPVSSRAPRRPPVRTFRVDDLRALTLGDVAEQTRRNRHFIAIVALVLVVRIWFAGEMGGLPIPQLFSADTPPATSTTVAPEREQAATDVLSSVVSRGSMAAAGSGRDGGFESLFEDLGGPDQRGSGGDDDSDDDDGDDTTPPECDAEALITVAEEAQFLLEGPAGDDAPDLAGLAREAAGCGASAEALGALYVLGSVAPFDDPVLLRAVKPLIGPTCGRVLNIAIGEAFGMRMVTPATRNALAFCVAAANVEDEPAAELETPVRGGVPEAPATTVPSAPGVAPQAPSSPVELPGGVSM